MNRPNRYISRESLDDATVSFEGLRWFYEGKDWMCDRIDKLEEDLTTLKRMTPYGAINYIRYGIGYEEYLKDYASYRKIKVDDLYEVMEELAESAKGYKGLEYDRVFLMDVNEGTIPYHKAVSDSSIEEERRLFYVGMTRARKELYILYAKSRHDKDLEVSRFLVESRLVPEELKRGQ